MTFSASRLPAYGLIFALTAAFPVTAFAIGSEQDETKPPAKTETTKDCKDGKVWDDKKKKCVNPQDAMLDDDTLYKAAREFAYDGQYENALKVLALMSKQNEPRVLNYKGFANRKAGRFEEGMRYYKQALEIDPNFILTRSYMGMAYMEQGNVKAAKLQLAEIRNRGGEDTWAYRALKDVIGGKRIY